MVARALPGCKIRAVRSHREIAASARSRRASPARALRATALSAIAIALFWAGSFPTGPVPAHAQRAAARAFHVREPIGIRRTEYPVSARVPFPRGVLAAPTQARLLWNGAEVPAQFTANATWDDGSVQALDVDFNVSLDPEEDRRFELQYGDGVSPLPFDGRGLTVAEDAASVTVGSLRFSRSGTPLLASVGYRGENIGAGANGLTITDANGQRTDLTAATDARLEVLKAGPLLVTLRYTATIRLADEAGIPVELLMEIPNSKSWIKTTAIVTDRTRRLRDIAVERPYRFGSLPLLWDFGTDSGAYGVFRSDADTALLTQTVSSSGPTGWKIEAGPGTRRRAIETSAGSRGKSAAGWGHLHDAGSAVAFAVARFGKDPGTYTLLAGADGQATYRFAPSDRLGQYQVVLYEHFVATPIQVGAATNPTSMVTPLSVALER